MPEDESPVELQAVEDILSDAPIRFDRVPDPPKKGKRS
jgi:hypothetical protein